MKYDKTKPETIASLFDDIAERYDLSNSINSWNIHKRWNKLLVKKLFHNSSCDHFLDLCSGTGAIALTLHSHFTKKNIPLPKTTILDFSEKMLEIAKNRLDKKSWNVDVCRADACALPYEQETFDRVAIAYGIRNIFGFDQCFKEVYRTLRSGGQFAILELGKPDAKLMRFFHKLYLQVFVPLVGRICTKNKDAYEYLNDSVMTFVPVQTIVQKLQDVGFSDIQTKRLSFGIATLILCKKNRC